METIKVEPVTGQALKWLRNLRNQCRTFLGNQDIVSLEDQEGWFERIRMDPTVKYFLPTIKKENMGVPYRQWVGLIRITHIDMINRSACIGCDIHETYRKNGYGKQAFEWAKQYCVDILNLRRLWLLVLETNERAIKMYEKCGFQEEGRQKKAIWRDGKYIDYIMMSEICEC